MKKLIAIVLVLIICMSLVPMAAFADDTQTPAEEGSALDEFKQVFSGFTLPPIFRQLFDLFNNYSFIGLIRVIANALEYVIGA